MLIVGDDMMDGETMQKSISTQTYEQRENNNLLKYMYYQNIYNMHRYV